MCPEEEGKWEEEVKVQKGVLISALRHSQFQSKGRKGRRRDGWMGDLVSRHDVALSLCTYLFLSPFFSPFASDKTVASLRPPSSLLRPIFPLLYIPFLPPLLQSHSTALVFMVDEENPLGRNSFSSASSFFAFRELGWREKRRREGGLKRQMGLAASAAASGNDQVALLARRNG